MGGVRAFWPSALFAIVAAFGAPLSALAETRHTVRPGETLSAVAARYGLSLRELAERNHITDVHHIVEGQSLVISTSPATLGTATGHRVAAGESLVQLARRYGVSVGDLAAANRISNPNLILVGQWLQLPGGIGGAQPSPGSIAEHHVDIGETLSSIAGRYGVGLSTLAASNNILNPNLVFVGQVLRIPGTSPPVADRASIEQALIDAEREFGLPNGLMRALAMQESGWQQHVLSPAGAVGVTQLLPSTAEWLVRDFLPDATNWRSDARHNARLGALQMWLHLRNYDGDVNTALAAYYQGAGNLARYGLFGDTRLYINNVRALMERYD